jgi:hypothetical protein
MVASTMKPQHFCSKPRLSRFTASWSRRAVLIVTLIAVFLSGLPVWADTIPAGTKPMAVVVGPVTNKTYIANQTSNSLTAIDGATRTTQTVNVGADAASLAALVSATGTIWGRTGFDLATALTPLSADADGVRHIGIPELGRLEVSLGGFDERGGGSSAVAEVSADRRSLGGGGSGQPRGFLVANGTLRDLPAGSHLDPATGVFTWAPGPGYIGTYRLTFVRGAQQIPIDVTIRPAGTVDPTQGDVRMFIDAPATDQIANGPVTIAGWALDPQAAIDSGIDAMHVWAISAGTTGTTDTTGATGTTGTTATRATSPAQFLGAATLGGPRPDVAGAYGAQFNRAGYSFTTSALAPGDYDIVVYVHSARTGRWEDARTVRVTVH